MKSIVFIEKETFLENLLKLSLKEEGVSVFCPDKGMDHFYLINDVKPEVVLVDMDSLEDSGDGFLQKWNENTFDFKVSLIFIGSKPSKELEGIPFISKPLSPSTIYLEIKNCL